MQRSWNGIRRIDICYIFLVITFFRFVKRNGKTAVNGATE